MVTYEGVVEVRVEDNSNTHRKFYTSELSYIANGNMLRMEEVTEELQFGDDIIHDWVDIPVSRVLRIIPE